MMEKKKCSMANQKSLTLEYTVEVKVYKESSFQNSRTKADWQGLFDEKSGSSLFDSKIFKTRVMLPEEGAEWKTILNVSTAKKNLKDENSNKSCSNSHKTPLKNSLNTVHESSVELVLGSDTHASASKTLTSTKRDLIKSWSKPTIADKIGLQDRNSKNSQKSSNYDSFGEKQIKRGYTKNDLISEDRNMWEIADNASNSDEMVECSGEDGSGDKRRSYQEIEIERPLNDENQISREQSISKRAAQIPSISMGKESYGKDTDNPVRKLVFENDELVKKLGTQHQTKHPQKAQEHPTKLNTTNPANSLFPEKPTSSSIGTQTQTIKPTTSDFASFTHGIQNLKIDIIKNMYFGKKERHLQTKLSIQILPSLVFGKDQSSMGMSFRRSGFGYLEADNIRPDDLRNTSQRTTILNQSQITQKRQAEESDIWNVMPTGTKPNLLESKIMRQDSPQTPDDPANSPTSRDWQNHSAVKVIDIDSFNMKNSDIAQRLISLESPQNENRLNLNTNPTSLEEIRAKSHGTFGITPETQLEDLAVKLRDSKQECHSLRTQFSAATAALEHSSLTLAILQEQLAKLQIDNGSLVSYQHKCNDKMNTLHEELDRVTEEYMFTKQDLSAIFNAVIESGDCSLLRKVEFLMNKRSFLNK